MAGGGSKPGERRGGRQKGTPNKRSSELAEQVAASGIPPMEITLKVARDLFAKAYNEKGELVDQECALLASQEAARTFNFLYPKLASIEATVTGKISHEMALAQLK